MNRTRLSPIDILGITLGVIVILIVIGSVVVIAQGRMFDFRWSIPELRGSWANPQLSIGGPVREEKDEKVTGDFAEIEVRSIAGSIEISGTSAAGVNVHSVKTALFRNAADNVHVEIRKEGNRLVVEEKHEPRFFFPTGTISFQVAIPAGSEAHRCALRQRKHHRARRPARHRSEPEHDLRVRLHQPRAQPERVQHERPDPVRIGWRLAQRAHRHRLD